MRCCLNKAFNICDLLLNGFGTRTSCRNPLGNASLKRNLGEKIFLKQIAVILVILKRHCFKHKSVINAMGNDLTDKLVCASEGESLLCKIIGKVGCVDEAFLRCRIHILLDNLHRFDHRSKDFETLLNGSNAVEYALLVLLHILVVCKGNTLENGEHSEKVAVNTAGLASDKLRHVGVLLLRHDA